jgi:hypothetical protein
VPSTTLAYSDPFGNGLRPYLVLAFTGINGTSGNIVGLLDTGADSTALPTGYAALMGYGPDQLERREIGTAAGLAYCWQAMVPCSASVVGAPALETDLSPTFVASATPLWGRGDIMRLFALTIEDRSQQFTLSW